MEYVQKLGQKNASFDGVFWVCCW